MCCHHGIPVPDVELLALFPDNDMETNNHRQKWGGTSQPAFYAPILMTVFAAATGYTAHLEHEWVPAEGALAIEMQSLPEGGAVIFSEATGYLPLSGRLNPIRDTLDRPTSKSIAIGRANSSRFTSFPVLRPMPMETAN